MGKIRWLHISDLHYDREMMGDWPAGQNGFPVTGIDFIVFTGDLHTYGRDYNEGKRFLTELAKHYNLNPSLRRRDPGSVDSVPCSYPRTRNQSKVVFHHIAQIFHRDLILIRDTALTYDLPVTQRTAASLIP